MKFLRSAILTISTTLLFSCTENKNTDYFSNFPKGADPVEVGQVVANRFLSRPHSNTGSWYTEEQQKDTTLFNNPVGYVVYPDVCAWYGALLYAKETKNQDLLNRLIERAAKVVYGEEKNLIPVANHVDNNVFGVIPLEVYGNTKDKRFLDLGLYMADEQFKELTPEEVGKLQPNEQEWYKQGLSWNTRMWIDDMYMITILQAQAYKVTGDKKYIERAGREMVVYLDNLQRENGLFHHADDVPIYWGRGNGWMAAGMAELLAYLPEDDTNRARIMEGYQKMMKTLLQYQNAEGMWNQILDDPKAWPETSGTGMFAFAFIKGVKKGWLDAETYGEPARKAWIALCSYINADGDMTQICTGTNKKNDYQYYLDREKVIGDLHGQAPVLWCAAAILE